MTSVQVQKLHTLTGHRDCVYTLQPTPGPAFFSGAGDGMVVLWDPEQGEEGTRIAQLPNSIYALHTLPPGDVLIVGHNYEGIHLIDWRNKTELGSLKLNASAIFDIQSFGKECFIACGDGLVAAVDTSNLTIRARLIHSPKSARTIAIHATLGEIAVGYSDNYIRIFALDDLKLKYQWMAHSSSVFSLAYMPGSTVLVSGSRDAHLKTWNAGQNYSPGLDVVAHLYAINHIAFSPNGKHFVTCSMDKSVKVWTTEDLTLLKVIDKARHAGHGTSVNKLLWSSFNNQLASASDDRTISIWDVIF